MDPQLGRWHVVDALAEKYLSTSPYAYTTNDPINHIDVTNNSSIGMNILAHHITFLKIFLFKAKGQCL